jgi:hypothetical protein
VATRKGSWRDDEGGEGWMLLEMSGCEQPKPKPTTPHSASVRHHGQSPLGVEFDPAPAPATATFIGWDHLGFSRLAGERWS